MSMSPCKLSKATQVSTGSNHAIYSARSEKDGISQLPDELIHTILSYLYLRDAVKISALSHRWKHLYKSLSQLEFGWNTILPELCNACEKPCVLYQEKYVGAVNQFLRFYQGSKLSSFVIKCCLGPEWTKDIDGWVSFALRLGTETLDLRLYCNNICKSDGKLENAGGVEGLYGLKSELFEGLKTNTLKHLALSACNLGKNLTCQFPSLESLFFAYSPLSLYPLNSLFSSLPKLKVLTFKMCTLPTKLLLNLLPLLEKFEVCGSNELEEIELLNVNLVTFICLCPAKTISFDLRGAPNLQKISYGLPGLQHFFTHLSKHVPKQLTTLHVFANYIWVTFKPETISVFSQVTTLYLGVYFKVFYALKIISTLRAFPLLCDLGLETNCEEDFDEKIGEACEYVPKHLRKVTLNGFRGTRNQLEFAVYLLKNASGLRQLFVKSETRFPPKRPWDLRERFMIILRLQKFAKDKVQLFI